MKFLVFALLVVLASWASVEASVIGCCGVGGVVAAPALVGAPAVGLAGRGILLG
jgi:hypothetical protein